MKKVFKLLALTIFLCSSGVVAWRPPAEAFAAPAPEGKKKANEVMPLQYGVLIAPGEKTIFLAKIEGGIEAIDMVTGHTLWQTKKEEGMRWPVAVFGRKLVVRVRDNPLRIAALDLDAKGKMVWITEPVLPEWVKGPNWMEERNRAMLPERERAKPDTKEIAAKEFLFEARTRGAYRCEEQIEKGEFVMRWQAATDLVDLDKPSDVSKVKEASGIVFVDLETGKIRTQPLEKDRKIEEKVRSQPVEWEGIVFSVVLSTDGALVAVDKKTNKVLWQRTVLEEKRYERKNPLDK
jgi:hypothetical protein